MVIHFNHLKPYLPPCPGPSTIQDDGGVGLPGEMEGVPCQSRSNDSAADVPQQQQPWATNCATSVLQPTANGGEQGAAMPLQGPTLEVLEGETPRGKRRV